MVKKRSSMQIQYHKHRAYQVSSKPLDWIAKQRIVISLCLFFCFFVLYVYLGLTVSETRLLGIGDVLFEADIPRVMACLTDPSSDYTRTQVHPLFVIIIYPIGKILKLFIESKSTVAVLVNSFLAAMQIPMMQRLLMAQGVLLMRSIVFSCLLGCSTAHVVFASVPETYAASGLSLIIITLLFCSPRPRKTVLLGAGVFCFGMLITNLVPILLLRFFTLSLSLRERIRKTVRFGFEILLISTSLSVLQLLLWPKTTAIFWGVLASGEESAFMTKYHSCRDVLSRAVLVIKHAFLTNVVAQVPQVSIRGGVAIFSTMKSIGGSFSLLGYIGITLWLLLSGFAILGYVIRRPPLSMIAKALIAYIIYILCFHMIYGDELFLYAQTWTFVVISLVCIGTNSLNTKRWGLVIVSYVEILTVLTCVHSVQYVFRVAAAFR